MSSRRRELEEEVENPPRRKLAEDEDDVLQEEHKETQRRAPPQATLDCRKAPLQGLRTLAVVTTVSRMPLELLPAALEVTNSSE
eukprot:3248725-Rhodomonas_salina.1